MKNSYLFLIFISSLFLSSTTYSAEIKVMILYGPWMADHTPQGDIAGRIQSLEDTTNMIYEDSNVDITMSVVHHQFVDLDPGYESAPQEDMSRDMIREKDAFENIDVGALRDQYAADFVILYHPAIGACGVVTGSRHISVVAPNCGAYVQAHELGHNMGLLHSHLQHQNGGAATDYAYGYGVMDEYVTVMAYQSVFNAAQKVYLLSDPNLDCDGSTAGLQPCGIPVTEPEPAHATKLLNEMNSLYASKREPVAAGLLFRDTNLQDCVSTYGQQDIRGLFTIDCPGRGITRLDSIDQLVATKFFDLSDNELDDVRHLLSLDQSIVEYINLTGNDQAFCHSLEQVNERFPGKVTLPVQCFDVAPIVATVLILR